MPQCSRIGVQYGKVATDPPNGGAGGAGVGACGIFGSDIRNWILVAVTGCLQLRGKAASDESFCFIHIARRHKLDCAPIWKQDFICS